MRSHSSARLAALSEDAGQTWGAPWPTLAETQCEGSLLALANHTAGPVLVQVCAAVCGATSEHTSTHPDPLQPTPPQSSAFAILRENLALHTSRDNGHTWDLAVSVYPGSAAYSTLVENGSDGVALAFERDNYAHISFVAELPIP